MVERAREGALVNGHTRGKPSHDTLVAKPLVGKILIMNKVNALKVKRSRAAVTAKDVAGVTTG